MSTRTTIHSDGVLAGAMTFARALPVRSAVHAMVLVTTLVALLLVLDTSDADAQTLIPKRTLTTGVAPGCGAVTAPPAGSRRDNSEARRLASEAQEAAMVGDRATARSTFARAAALNPMDERIAYDLGRAHEELSDTVAAVGEYCRYLTLTADGREAPDVRSRLSRLMPPSTLQNAERANDSFQQGLRHYDARRFDAAADAFTETIRRSPPAVEGVFNRALARAAAGRRTDASRDLEAYLVAAPLATDRAPVLRAIELLRRPVYSSGTAFTRGLIPGFGQFYTGRPLRGVVVLAAVTGAGVMAAMQRTETKTIPYVDPNGVPVPYEETSTRRPYLVPGIAAGFGLTMLAAWEASRFATHSQEGVVRVSSYVGMQGSVGVRVEARF
jgi:tetratricopeptide (TPR) repeat protein